MDENRLVELAYDKARLVTWQVYNRAGLQPDEKFPDAVQEAAIKFWELWHRDKKVEDKTAYCVGAARNAAKSAVYRSGGRHSPISTVSLDAPLSDSETTLGEMIPCLEPEEPAILDIERHELRTLMRKILVLDPQSMKKQQDPEKVLLLYQVLICIRQNMPVDQVASELSLPYEKARHLYRNTAQKLATLWEINTADVPARLEHENLHDLAVWCSYKGVFERTLDDYVDLVDLILQGHGNESLCIMLDMSYPRVQGMRTKIRQCLAAYAKQQDIDNAEYVPQSGGCTTAHYYSDVFRGKRHA